MHRETALVLYILTTNTVDPNQVGFFQNYNCFIMKFSLCASPDNVSVLTYSGGMVTQSGNSLLLIASADLQ